MNPKYLYIPRKELEKKAKGVIWSDQEAKDELRERYFIENTNSYVDTPQRYYFPQLSSKYDGLTDPQVEKRAKGGFFSEPDPDAINELRLREEIDEHIRQVRIRKVEEDYRHLTRKELEKKAKGGFFSKSDPIAIELVRRSNEISQNFSILMAASKNRQQQELNEKKDGEEKKQKEGSNRPKLNESMKVEVDEKHQEEKHKTVFDAPKRQRFEFYVPNLNEEKERAERSKAEPKLTDKLKSFFFSCWRASCYESKYIPGSTFDCLHCFESAGFDCDRGCCASCFGYKGSCSNCCEGDGCCTSACVDSCASSEQLIDEYSYPKSSVVYHEEKWPEDYFQNHSFSPYQPQMQPPSERKSGIARGKDLAKIIQARGNQDDTDAINMAVTNYNKSVQSTRDAFDNNCRLWGRERDRRKDEHENKLKTDPAYALKFYHEKHMDAIRKQTADLKASIRLM